MYLPDAEHAGRVARDESRALGAPHEHAHRRLLVHARLLALDAILLAPQAYSA